MYYTYAYKLLKDSTDVFPYEKYTVDQIEDTDPENTSTPLEYFNATVNQRRISAESDNSAAVESWAALKAGILEMEVELKRVLERNNYNASEYFNGWKLGCEGFMKKYLSAVNELEILIYGNNSSLLGSTLYSNGGSTATGLIPAVTNGTAHEWLTKFDTEDSGVRPVIDSTVYAKFTKAEAKELIVAIRNKFVRSVEDTASDTAKMTNILATALVSLYNAAKDKIEVTNSTDKAVIEALVAAQTDNESRGYTQLVEDPAGLITELYSSEKAINEIITLIYSNLKD